MHWWNGMPMQSPPSKIKSFAAIQRWWYLYPLDFGTIYFLTAQMAFP
jgi:hypothetical protein